MNHGSPFAGPLIVCDRPRGLEIVRCRRFSPGAREAAERDGAAQMCLPLGEWIVGLREVGARGR
jgi:hypothetical protein